MKNTLTMGFVKAGADFRRVAPRALFKKQNKMMTEMKKRTPVETGTARDSGQVDPPEWKGNTLHGTMGFGGAAEEYIVPLHERLDVHHPIGQAKFMESVLKEEDGNIVSEVSADIQRMLKL